MMSFRDIPTVITDGNNVFSPMYSRKGRNGGPHQPVLRVRRRRRSRRGLSHPRHSNRTTRRGQGVALRPSSLDLSMPLKNAASR